MTNNGTPCNEHEQQIQENRRQIAELQTRADYKDKRIDELNETMKEVQRSVDQLDKTINEYIIKSIKDDNTLREIINKQDNRITALESRIDTLYKLLLSIPAILALLGVIAVYIQYIH